MRPQKSVSPLKNRGFGNFCMGDHLGELPTISRMYQFRDMTISTIYSSSQNETQLYICLYLPNGASNCAQMFDRPSLELSIDVKGLIHHQFPSLAPITRGLHPLRRRQPPNSGSLTTVVCTKSMVLATRSSVHSTRVATSIEPVFFFLGKI